MNPGDASGPPLYIAWAEEKDIAALIPLMLALYDDDPSEGQAPTNESAARHVAQILAPSTPHRLALAFQDGAPIGLAAVAFILSINEARPERWRQMELKELFVLPEHRDAGVGAALMNWITERAKEARDHRMDWHVKAGNARAQAFYRRFGGVVVEDRRSMRKSPQ